MTEANYVERDVDIHVWPLGQASLLHQDRCVLKFGQATVDVGALCYLRRSESRRTRAHKPRPVDPTSFDKSRVGRVRELVSALSQLGTDRDHRTNSSRAILRSFITFVGWCDNAGHAGMFGSEQDARDALRLYVEHLRHRVNTNTLNVNSAAGSTVDVAVVLGRLLQVDDITRGIRLLQRSQNATNTTAPPDDDAQRRVLSLCDALFTGITTHVIANTPFPFQLAMPRYLGWQHDFIWVFPANPEFMAPHRLAKREELKQGNWAFNYAEGRFATIDEIVMHYSSVHCAEFSLSDAINNLAKANTNPRHTSRLQLATLAHRAFVLLFLSRTGMNWAQMRNLKWGDDYVVGTERQGFREIKYRARGKWVSFSIESRFLTAFRRFLELRTYLLGGKHFAHLFLSQGRKASGRPTQIGEALLKSLFRTLHRIDPQLPRVLARQWRAGKFDFMLRHTDAETAALVMQNSPSTARKHYMTGSQTTQIAEFGDFYAKLQQAVRDDDVDGSAAGALNHCQGFGDPQSLEESPPVVPDCQKPEGCLFCAHYIVHADEMDVRKLSSCRTCLYRTAHLAESEEHFQELFGEVLRRIDAVLAEIVAKSDEHAKLVERVRVEVEDEGRLDHYWQQKIIMLEGLGVVSHS
jgi:hypothetical protein